MGFTDYKKMNMKKEIKYFIVGELPVFYELDENNNVIQSFKMDWKSGEFIQDNDYWLKIRFSRIDEIDEVDRASFVVWVKKHREDGGFLNVIDQFS
jgi:hypothetical protein